MEEVAQATTNLVPNATIRHHVGKAPRGQPLSSTNKPTSNKLGKEYYTLPHPHKHTHRILAASDIHRWAMWFCQDGPDDGACLVTIDLEAKLSEQVHHLQSECRVCGKSLSV